MTTMVRAMLSAIMASGLSHSEKVFLLHAPRSAPGMVMVSLPRKNAVKNFAGLYLRSPRGITTGSSGIGVAAAV